MSPELRAIGEKIERVGEQMSDIETRIAGFLQDKPFRLRKTFEDGGAKEVWAFELVKRMPPRLPTVVGEALHNLRSVLDQICCMVAVRAGRSETGVVYPFGDSEATFLAALAKQRKTAAAHDLIKASRPYPAPAGNLFLYALHDLNRRDKHRSGVMPVVVPGGASASRIVFWQGLPFSIGPRNGQHLNGPAGMVNPKETVFNGKPQAVYSAGNGEILFWSSPIKEGDALEFMVTTPGARFETNFSPSLGFVFDYPGLERIPVLEVLGCMRSEVEAQVRAIAGACLA